MVETELERLIIIANDDYPNLEQKLTFINSRLGHYTKHPTDKTKFIIKPGHHNQIIKRSKYYEIRAKLDIQTKKRAQDVNRGRLAKLLNVRVALNGLHTDIRNAMTKAQEKEKYGAVNSLISTKAQLYSAETKLEEMIYYITTNHKYIANEYELMMDDVEDLNERISLFTNRY